MSDFDYVLLISAYLVGLWFTAHFIYEALHAASPALSSSAFVVVAGWMVPAVIHSAAQEGFTLVLGLALVWSAAAAVGCYFLKENHYIEKKNFVLKKDGD